MGSTQSIPCDCTVKDFDPIKFQGTWWEIAKIPLIYQKDCDYSSTGYTWNPSTEKLKVVNTCYANDQIIKTIEGEARIPNKADSSKLKLKVLGPDASRISKVINGQSDFKNGEDVESDYLVHWTDYDDFAIMGSCDSDRLHGTMMGTRNNGAELVCILSRQKYICRCRLNRMMDKFF